MKRFIKKPRHRILALLLAIALCLGCVSGVPVQAETGADTQQAMTEIQTSDGDGKKESEQEIPSENSEEKQQDTTSQETEKNEDIPSVSEEPKESFEAGVTEEESSEAENTPLGEEAAAVAEPQYKNLKDNQFFVDDGWICQYTDDTKSKVYAIKFLLDAVNAKNWVSDMQETLPDFPDTYKVQLVIPATVMYNGVEYPVVGVGQPEKNGSGFIIRTGTNPDDTGDILHVSKIILSEGIERIENGTFSDSIMDNLEEIVLPNTINYIGPHALRQLESMKNIELPSSVQEYGEGVFSNNVFDELIFPESDTPCVIRDVVGVYSFEATRIELPKNIVSVGEDCFGGSYKLQTFSMWNTTTFPHQNAMDFTGCGAGSADAANSGTKGTGNYILKSEKALDLTKDETYLTLKNAIEPGSTQQLVYGIVTINSTDPEKFEMEKGSAKELHITVEAKTGNDKVDITTEYAPDWVDTGYTWTLEGNTSANTVIEGNTVKIGEDETADKITLTATSVYDENKKVSFEITPVKATPKNICQIIKGSTYDETTGTYEGGTYVDKYSTLQDAIASLSGDGDEVIEMLVDYEIPTSDVATITDKKCSITTAPKSGHTAGNNSNGEEPGVYTGTGIIASIKRAADKTGEVFNLAESTECTISNLTIDGANINANRALILAKDTAVLNLFVGTTFENGKCTGYTTLAYDGGLSGRGGAVYSLGSTTNITEGVVIKNNSSESGGGMYVEGGTITMTGGIFENNQVTYRDTVDSGGSGRGGGIAMYFSTLNLSGGNIENNTAEKYGGGIYVDEGLATDQITKNVIRVSGDPRIINNKGEGATENLYLREGIYVDAVGELIDSAYIGVTASGQDMRKTDRMQESGIFGRIRETDGQGVATTASYRKSLEHFVNDQDSNLYGFDAGILESYGRCIQWMPKSDYNEYVCKIKNQGYYTINDALVDIAKNKEDSQNPTDSKAIPEGNVYKIEMLVEEYTLARGLVLPEQKHIILTTAQENASGVAGALDYRGTSGTHCVIKRGEWTSFQPLLTCSYVSSALTLKNIIFDGQGGNSWKDDQGNTVVGTGNITASSQMLAIECHKLVIDEGAIFRNSKSSESTIECYFRNENLTSYPKVESIMKDGAVFQGNSVTDAGGRSPSISFRAETKIEACLIIEGGTIRDNTSVVDSLTGAVHSDGTKIEMLGGEITENLNMSGVFVENDVASAPEYKRIKGSFDMKGGIISKNTGGFFAGGVTMMGGSFNMSGGSIVGNKAIGYFGQGGGVQNAFEQASMTITGGKIVGNTASISGGGIYAISSEYPVTISGTAQIYGNAVGETAEPNDKGEAVLGDKGSKNNVHLANDALITVGGKLDDTAKIGITAEGKDETAKDRMTSGARFGVNSDNAQDVLDSLDRFFRDTNGTAADGIRLYGADGGVLDAGDPDNNVVPTYKVVWEPKQFTLTFDANGGTGTMKDILHDGETPLNLEENSFTYPGHKFLGWNTKADGKGDVVEDKKQGYEPGMKDITLYAQWESTDNTLTVSNVVVDAPEGFDGNFDYKLTVKVPEDSALPTSIDCINSGDAGTTSITLNVNGEGEFSLKPGANIILRIPRDATYTIEQTKKNDYQTVNAVNGGAQSNSLTTGEIPMNQADSSVVFTNTKLYTLTLHKAMTGDFIDSAREFTFDVAITYTDGTTKTEKLTLKKDGSASLMTPLFKGTKVTITEAAASGYSTSYVVNGDDANKIEGRILTDLSIDGDKDVVCTNHSEIAITGVNTGSSNHLPIMLAGAFLILLLMSGTILRLRYLRKKGRI